MEKTKRGSGYRWVILFSIFPIIISTEMMWLSLAPVASVATEFYGVTSLWIDMFSLSYMIMFILFSIPASWVVDHFGYRHSLIIGSVLTMVFGAARAVFADQFTIVLLSQFMIAIGQPFLLNISTKVPANWFPENERSTAAGILTMAQYVGFAIPMVIAPILVEETGIPGIFTVFAIIAVCAGLLSIFLTKEKPEIPPEGPVAGADEMSLDSIKKLFKNPNYIIIMLVCFISMGIFNSVLTLIESILLPRGITSAQAGIIGAVFVVAGVIGAVVLPILSDKLRIRKPFFTTSIFLLIPVYLGFTFLTNFVLLVVIAGIGGFMIMGVAPILFQHGSETAYPVKEGTSLGLFLLMGQISGVLLVYLFEILKDGTGSVVYPMLIFVLATIIELPIVFRVKETTFLKDSE